MPWCEDCAKYFAPSSMTSDGKCPTCGRHLEAQQPKAPITAKNLDLRKLAAGDDVDDEDVKTPWHFKLLMVLLVLYFVYRIVQLFR
jgi:hypothetical protein